MFWGGLFIHNNEALSYEISFSRMLILHSIEFFIILEIPILWYEILDMFSIYMAYYQTESVVAVLRIYFQWSKIDAKLNEPYHLSLWNPYLIITLIIGIIMGRNSLKQKWWIDFKYIDIN